uniref:Uncharacterized protein n=1 Tax=Meloidogyne incognita TaxID=6306 RepID=A0A914L1N4_MELIC
MGLLLINILTLFLLLNFKFGDTIECYFEEDLANKTGARAIEPLGKCLEKFANKCLKFDCGEYGFSKGCGNCKLLDGVAMLLGLEEDQCTCSECDTDLCNSSIGVLSNMKILLLVQVFCQY